VLVTAPNQVEVVTEPLPDMVSNEALVRLLACGVCGSDRAGVQGEHAFVKPPYYPGHEAVGEVVALGSPVDGLSVGDMVVVQPTLSCGRCKMCRIGRDNLCDNLEFFGCGYREGGMADIFSVPAGQLYKVPGRLTPEQAALIEPLATPLHAVRLTGDLRGKAVAVFGAGTIGLLTLLAAKRAGAGRVVCTDLLASKRRLALDLGADAVVGSGDDGVAEAVRDELGESGDAVFDCVATQETLADAIKVATKGGTVTVVGGGRRPVTIDLPVLQEFQVRLQGSATYTREDFATATEMLSAPDFDASRFVTAVYPLARAAEAFQAILSGREVKVLVVPSDR
jgi:2-desacetyl-2-hydroxyethyl bacteriochlorophyllide A dehydrogenase